MKLQDKIAVMQAHLRGEQIQFRNRSPRSGSWRDDTLEWTNVRPNPIFNFGGYEYRVKPQPREFWINLYPEFQSFGRASGSMGYVHPSKESALLAKQPREHDVPTLLVREVLK